MGKIRISVLIDRGEDRSLVPPVMVLRSGDKSEIRIVDQDLHGLFGIFRIVQPGIELHLFCGFQPEE